MFIDKERSVICQLQLKLLDDRKLRRDHELCNFRMQLSLRSSLQLPLGEQPVRAGQICQISKPPPFK